MKERIAIISILANVALAGGKILVGIISNSAAILAEGFHSLMDVFSSAISYLGIRYSKKPSDDKHPYGHYKFEVLSGVFITLILFLTGAGIVYDAYRDFSNPQKIEIGYLAFSVMVVSAVANEIMARVKKYYGEKENSVSLLSDGAHSRVDVYASLVIIAGLILTKYFAYADAVLALVIGIYIVKESFSLGKEAVDSLLDVSAGEEVENEIRSIARAEGIETATLKTQKKGSVVTANLEIRLPNNLSVSEAVQASNDLRSKLISSIDRLSYVSIQIVSHDVETGFFKSVFGKDLFWQRKGRHRQKGEEAKKTDTEGVCVCEKCGHTIPHKRGVPCASMKCPVCGTGLERKL